MKKGDDRAATMPKNCGGCRYWSEMLAKVTEGNVVAYCLAPEGSPRKGDWVRKAEACEAWKSGHHGAVDSPPDDGETVRAKYDQEEAPKRRKA